MRAKNGQQYRIAETLTHAERSFPAEGFYRAYPSAEKPMNRAFAGRLKLLKEK